MGSRDWIQPDPDLTEFGSRPMIALLCLTLLTEYYYYYYCCYVFFTSLFMQMSLCSNKLLTVGENWLGK